MGRTSWNIWGRGSIGCGRRQKRRINNCIGIKIPMKNQYFGDINDGS